MSGRDRNIMPSAKVQNLSARYLPDIVTARPSVSPYESYAENGNQHKTRTASSSSDFYRSCASSAISRKFQDLFYRSGWPSLSDTGTDSSAYIEIESSGSSASSMFSWADPDATSLVAEEWEKIQRTLYDEPGPKVQHKRLIDECNQWKQMYPHFRITGKQCLTNKLTPEDHHDTEEEILATQYDSDGNGSIISNSKTLVNFQNNKKSHSNRTKNGFSCSKDVPNNQRTVKNRQNAVDLFDELDNCLHITPVNKFVNNNNNSPKNEKISSIIRSEISSSRWRNKGASPDFVNLSYRNKSYHKSQNNFNDRDSSAASVYSFMNKPNLLRNNQKILENYDNANSYDDVKISAYSTKTINGSYRTNHESFSMSKAHPIRSVSIPHDTNSLNKNSRGRNIFLPPLNKDEIKVSHNEVSSSNVSNKNRSKTRKKNLDPIDFGYKANINEKIYENQNDFANKATKKKKKRKSVV